jgi:NTE family protein
MRASSDQSDLALVLTGGGARAAYQVGVLRLLAREIPGLLPDVLTGVSAGGINAAFLAAQQGPFAEKVERLAEVWSNIRIDQVFRVDLRDLATRTLRWSGRLLSAGRSPVEPSKSLVDTDPLRAFLERVLEAEDGALLGIAKSLDAGWLRAIALTASSYTTGQSVTWVQTRQDRDRWGWERPQRKSDTCSMRVEHVMASAALPFLFPAIEVGGAWYGDGGIRLTAPLSPAIHLGARRLLAVSTRHSISQTEADRPLIAGYPPPAQVAGVLFNAIFLDLLDTDALHLHQINEMLGRLPNAEHRGLRHIELLVVRPSQDLGRLANAYEADLPRAFRFLTRGLGTRETRSNDMLSLVMFQRDYVKHLIALGENDAAARLPEIREFLSDPSDQSKA